jgi:hypothetical protein
VSLAVTQLHSEAELGSLLPIFPCDPCCLAIDILDHPELSLLDLADPLELTLHIFQLFDD